MVTLTVKIWTSKPVYLHSVTEPNNLSAVQTSLDNIDTVEFTANVKLVFQPIAYLLLNHLPQSYFLITKTDGKLDY